MRIEAQVQGRRAPARTVEPCWPRRARLLSGLSRGAGVVLAAKIDMRLKHIEFIRLEPTRGLVVLVGENGDGREPAGRPVPARSPARRWSRPSNYLNARIRGRTLAEARAEMERAQRERRPSSTG